MTIYSDDDPRRLNERVTIQHKTQTQDANGYVTDSWATLVTLWAAVDAARAKDVTPTAADEQPGDSQLLAARYYTIWVRWRNDLDTTMRVQWRGRVLDIRGIADNQKRARLMPLFCVTGLSEQG